METLMRMPRLPKRNFSLRAFLLTLFVLSLFGSNAYVSWKWNEARQEIDRLREELGYLTIDDPTRFYVREVPGFQPLSWRWRIYVPPGDHTLHLGSGGISAAGLNANSVDVFWTDPTGPLVGQFTLIARIERDQLGNWQLALSSPDLGVSHGIIAETGWLRAGNRPRHVVAGRKCRAEIAGSRAADDSGWKRQTESFSPDEPIVLLRLRAPEDIKTDTGQPCDGVLIWFEKPG